MMVHRRVDALVAGRGSPVFDTKALTQRLDRMDLPRELRQLNREGPDLIGPDEIATSIRDWNAK